MTSFSGLHVVNAVANAAAAVRRRTDFGKAHCLIAVREMFTVDADGVEPTAFAAWLREGGAGGPNTHTVKAPPANVPGFMKDRGPDGHIVVCVGAGWCYSTDFDGTHWVDDGRFHLVTIASLEDRGGMRWLGWSETLEGIRIAPHLA